MEARNGQRDRDSAAAAAMATAVPTAMTAAAGSAPAGIPTGAGSPTALFRRPENGRTTGQAGNLQVGDHRWRWRRQGRRLSL
ncbi:hypothetical protein ACT18_13435, partial [Mycolicibacter kumamotonensis]